VSAAEALTLRRIRAPLHQVSARRGVDLGWIAGRAAPFAGGTALSWAPGRALLLGGRPDLPATLAAITDQSSGLAWLRMAGPAADDLMARICRLDLAGHAFPPGSVARTPIAQVAVILYRPAPETLDLLVPATFAHSFDHALMMAGTPLGLTLLPSESL
jgi:heterotetrameric sarcosine oxidase gamma subunit